MLDKTIKISDFIRSSSLITRDAARDLFKTISVLPESQIILDFSDIAYASRSFFDELNGNQNKLKLLGKVVEYINLPDSLVQLNQKVTNSYISRNSFVYSSVSNAPVITV